MRPLTDGYDGNNTGACTHGLALTACTSVSPGDIHFENRLNLFVEGEFESAISEFERQSRR